MHRTIRHGENHITSTYLFIRLLLSAFYANNIFLNWNFCFVPFLFSVETVSPFLSSHLHWACAIFHTNQITNSAQNGQRVKFRNAKKKSLRFSVKDWLCLWGAINEHAKETITWKHIFVFLSHWRKCLSVCVFVHEF